MDNSSYPNDNITSLISTKNSFMCDWDCYLMLITEDNKATFIARSVFEVLTLIGVILYIISSALHLKRVGWRMFMRTLASFPAKIAFHLSFFIILLMIPLRAFCLDEAENVLAVMAILTTSVHFLFFCRGVKIVGPFVLMFYKMLAGDVLRFFVIYFIFLMGFSQAYYVIFSGCHREMNVTTLHPDVQKFSTVLSNPFDCVAHLFMASIGEMGTFYTVLPTCRLAWLGHTLFVIFELAVFVMLINMLIASMARTYEQISETQKEWKRQWAKVILMLEQSLTPDERRQALLKYSRPTGTDKNKRSFVVRTRLSEEEKQKQKSERASDRKLFIEEKRILYKRRLQGDMVGSQANPIPKSLQHLLSAV